MNLWDYIENGSGQKWLDYTQNGLSTGHHQIEHITNLGNLYPTVYEYMLDNRDICQEHCVKLQDYHYGETIKGSGLPATVGYDENNTYHANWGVLGTSNNDIKALIGGKEAFEKIGMQWDNCLCRLLVMPPGSIIPWHSDTMQGWRDRNAHINPHLVMASEFTEKNMTAAEARANSKCDLGLIGRRIIAVSDWHIGHIIQMKETFVTNWKSGDVWDSPPCVWHLTANAGIKLRISITVTGVLT